MAQIDEYCRTNMQESFMKDRAVLRGAEIRNVEIRVTGGGGSDNLLTIAFVQLDYRLPTQAEWQTARFRMGSDSQNILTRYSCGTFAFETFGP